MNGGLNVRRCYMPKIDAMFYVQNLERAAHGPYSPTASSRFRQIEPAIALAGMGENVGFISGAPELEDKHWDGVKNFMVGKIMHPELLDIVRHAQRCGVRIVVDICDDWRGKYYEQIYRELIEMADALTASTQGIAEIIETEYALPSTVIADCVEGDRKEPRGSIHNPVVLGYFGHSSNLKNFRMKMMRVLDPYELWICTNDIEKHAEVLGMKARYLEWSSEDQAFMFERVDAAILPYHEDRPWKSPNRILTALWAGLPVVAEDIGHHELSEFAYLGELTEALGQMRRDGRRVERIRAGQQYIQEHYLPEIVAKDWREVIHADS